MDEDELPPVPHEAFMELLAELKGYLMAQTDALNNVEATVQGVAAAAVVATATGTAYDAGVMTESAQVIRRVVVAAPGIETYVEAAPIAKVAKWVAAAIAYVGDRALDGVVEQLAGDAFFWAVDRSEEIASKAVTYTGEQLLDLVRIYTELLTRLR